MVTIRSWPAFMDWKAQCLEWGIDPDEVRLVSQRYDMYRNYWQGKGRQGLPLERWFNWYRTEKVSEAGDPAASGCSVDPNSANASTLGNPALFLKVLRSHREEAASS